MMQIANMNLFSNSVVNPLVLAMPLKQRGEFILERLVQSGCDLRRYLRRPTVGYGGRQRSGKTTLGVLSLILQKAIDGRRIYYITTDKDVYPVAFDGYMTSFDPDLHQAREKLQGVYWRYVELMTQSCTAEMSEQSWLLDEFTMSVAKLGNLTDLLWEIVLTEAARRGTRLGIVFHEKTAGANGVPIGKAELFKNEFAFLWTDREENLEGNLTIVPYYPSGKYTLLEFKGNQASLSKQTLKVPDWLKFDVNPAQNNACCPVRSLLRFFPELDVRAGAISTDLLQDNSHFFTSKLFGQSALLDPKTSDSSNQAFSLPSEMQKAFTALTLKKSAVKELEPRFDYLENSRHSITCTLLRDLSPANRLRLYISLGSDKGRDDLFEQLELEARKQGETNQLNDFDLENQSSHTHPSHWFIVGALAMIAVLLCGRTFAFLLDPSPSCSPTEQQVSPTTPPLSKAGG